MGIGICADMQLSVARILGRPFCSCDLDLDPMTFIYELDPYYLKMYRMCKYGLHKSRLSKVIVWKTDIQTDRQTDRQTYRSTEIIHHAALFILSKKSNHIIIIIRVVLVHDDALYKSTFYLLTYLFTLSSDFSVVHKLHQHQNSAH